MADATFDELMTAHMDAIREKANITGKLSIANATAAIESIVINPPSGGVDVSGVTATASDVLSTVKFVDSTGTLKNGLIATVTPTLNANVFTVSKGYIASNTTLEVPEMTIDNDGETITVPVGYNKTKQTFQIGGGTGSSDVAYGYIDASGNFQPLDLSGDTPVAGGAAESMASLDMFKTGVNEPSYTSGGGSSDGGSGIVFYECAVSLTTFINEAPVNPTQNQTAEYVITTSSEYDTNYNGYNAFSDTADQDKGWFCATGDDAPWVAIQFNEGFILESYSFAVAWDSRGQTLSKWKLEGSLDGTSWNTIDERETETLTSASPTFRAAIVNYSMYTHYRLSIENEYGHIGIQGWKLFSAKKTTGGTWSGYEMTQDADGGWLKSETLTEGLAIRGYNPVVGYIYNEDTTISVASMYVASQEGVTQ